MQRYIAFLRAINVGKRTVAMRDLRAHFEALGFAQVETFIASGNVIFSARGAAAALEGRIEDHLQVSLGFEVATFLRTDSEVAAIAKYRPFADSELHSGKALNVAFLTEPPGAGSRKLLMGLKSDIDDFHVRGREVYWLCRKNQSESDFSNAVLEKTLKMRSTLRGINTIHRLTAKYPPLS